MYSSVCAINLPDWDSTMAIEDPDEEGEIDPELGTKKFMAQFSKFLVNSLVQSSFVRMKRTRLCKENMRRKATRI